MTLPAGAAPEEGGPWRAIDVYRFFTLGYAVLLFLRARDGYLHPQGAWVVLAVMAGWSLWLALNRGRPAWVLWLDLAVAAACVLATALVESPTQVAHGVATLPSMWAAAPVASFALGRGWRTGLTAAAVISLADVIEVWPHVSASTLDSIVQLVLIGAVVGYVAQLHEVGQRRLARAVAVEAASRERERLAAGIHDSVLQVLAYAQRRGAELGGEAAEIGRLAGEQEIRLRAMVSTREPFATGEADLAGLLSALGGPSVIVAVPAGGVPLPSAAATVVLAAARTALDNVARHAGPGARAWVLLEDEGDMVTITVRDDGAGMPPGRLEAAEREGRLGIAAGIRGRIADCGGSVCVTSGPGEGTEVEMRVPRGALS